MALILVADDDLDIRELVAFRLRRDGHEVITVEDGVEALTSASDRSPDLIILDMMMPGLSGVDTARAVRDDPALADVRIIMLTARAHETDVVNGYHAGVDDYVAKPFSPRELSLRVSSLLARKR